MKTHLLLRLPLFGQHLLLFAFPKELALLGVLGCLGLCEIGVVDGFGDGNAGDVDFCRGCDDIGLTDTTEGNTVDSVCQPL